MQYFCCCLHLSQRAQSVLVVSKALGPIRVHSVIIFMKRSFPTLGFDPSKNKCCLLGPKHVLIVLDLSPKFQTQSRDERQSNTAKTCMPRFIAMRYGYSPACDTLRPASKFTFDGLTVLSPRDKTKPRLGTRPLLER